jgi:hypothetical protein
MRMRCLRMLRRARRRANRADFLKSDAIRTRGPPQDRHLLTPAKQHDKKDRRKEAGLISPSVSVVGCLQPSSSYAAFAMAAGTTPTCRNMPNAS